jgi:polysaccharide export outer membrane protein
MPCSRPSRRLKWWIWLLLVSCAGCLMHAKHVDPGSVPHEFSQVALPPYVIEPPDVLVINAVRLVPKPPYKIAPLDVLGIQVTKTLPEQPIAGLFSVDPDGTVNLGFTYGAVKLDGLKLEEAKKAIFKHLVVDTKKLKDDIEVTVVLAETRALQQIRGPHLVHSDGTVTLGIYGSVYVDNLTIAEAKAAIEEHLSQFLVKPEVSVDVSGFNSKVYYVITDGGGQGEPVARLPVTGKTTVLDALSQINGLPPVASKCNVYIVRPAPAGSCSELVLKVNWNGIVRRGETATNYQVLPNDRIYVMADPLVTTDTYLGRIISPIERLFGVVLLGDTTVRLFQTPIFRNATATTPVQ